MSNHAFYIACSYAALLLAIALELWQLRRQRREAIARALETERIHS